MKPWLLGGVLGLTAVALLAADRDGLARRNGWQSDLARARSEARRSRKLLFVVFRCQP